MKQYLFILFYFITSILYAQNAQTSCTDTLAPNTKGYYFLCCDNIKYFEKELHITAKAVSTKIDSFDCYKFIFSYGQTCPNLMDSSILNFSHLISSLSSHKLIINNKPFTGYFKIANSYKNHPVFLIRETTFYNCQFKNGYLEVMNRKYDLVNEQEIETATPMKPVVYLYPTQTQDIKVEINLINHKFTHVYPAYNNGWQVAAKPDGTLINKATGKEHYCLFWETEGTPMAHKIDSGFVVKGIEAAAFLEEKLISLGLSNKEANEFIIFWLPQMENNPYNAIYFANKEYERISQLNITPKPKNTIRIMMLWQALEKPIDLFPQILPEKPKREGFTAVEWGGTIVNCFDKNP